MSRKEFLLAQISEAMSRCAHDQDKLYDFEGALIEVLLQFDYRMPNCDPVLCQQCQPRCDIDCKECWRETLDMQKGKKNDN